MKDLPELLELVKTAFQIVVLFLAIAAILTGEKARMRNAQDLATLMTFVSEHSDAPAYTPVDEPIDDENVVGNSAQ